MNVFQLEEVIRKEIKPTGIISEQIIQNWIDFREKRTNKINQETLLISIDSNPKHQLFDTVEITIQDDEDEIYHDIFIGRGVLLPAFRGQPAKLYELNDDHVDEFGDIEKIDFSVYIGKPYYKWSDIKNEIKYIYSNGFNVIDVFAGDLSQRYGYSYKQILELTETCIKPIR